MKTKRFCYFHYFGVEIGNVEFEIGFGIFGCAKASDRFGPVVCDQLLRSERRATYL